MIEEFVYKNHVNEEIRFGDNGMFANASDLRDYSWKIRSRNDRVSGFKRGIVTKTIPLIIQCNTKKEGIEMRNALFECTEKDILAKQYGRIIIGEYYLPCYVTASKKTDYFISERYMKISIEITTDIPFWTRETAICFRCEDLAGGKNMDYNNDFLMDYTSNMSGTVLKNDNFADSNFRMIIYGPCNNPEITIAGHSYKVNTTVNKNEYLTIDSVEKTISLAHADGTSTNCFHSRERKSYIFQKIPPGENKVSISAFPFDVILLEERSEPKWT